MELKKKFKLIFWAFIILLLLNISTIIFLIVNKPILPFPPREKPLNMQQQDQHFIDYIAQNIDLSKEQMDKIAGMRDKFLDKTHSNLDSLHFYNDQIDLLMQNYNDDSSKINDYSSKIAFFHTQLKLNFAHYYFNILSVLTSEQKIKYYDVYQDFRKCNMQPNPDENKHRNRNGHRYGNQINN